LIFVVVLVLIWQWAASGRHIDPFFFGRPSKVWDLLVAWSRDGTLSKEVGSTAVLLVVGFVSGIVVGSALGVLLAVSRLAKDVFEPYIVFLNAVPRIILYPFLIVWLGVGLTPKVVTIVLVLVPTVAINISAGFKDIQGEYLSNMRALGARRRDLAIHVYAPSLTLWILSTCRVTFAFAFQATILAELLVATKGLGFLVDQGQSNFNVNEIFAAMALVVLMAVVADALLGLLERRVTRWMPQT